MKIKYKSRKEIEKMIEGGKILSEVRDRLSSFARPGISTWEIEALANKLIEEKGAEASFKKVPGYNWATCVSINEEIVHTPPSPKRFIKEGDLLSIDVGVYYKGYHTDTSVSLIVGKKKDKRVERFLEVGRRALNRAIEAFKKGKKLKDVSMKIESVVEGEGYKVINELTGHGVGKELHEDPIVWGRVFGSREDEIEIKEGLVVAIEVIYSRSTHDIRYGKDGWSLETADGSLSACFEKTVGVMEGKTIIITP